MPDLEIHHTVLIASTFRMLNRCVNGLATIASTIPLFTPPKRRGSCNGSRTGSS